MGQALDKKRILRKDYMITLTLRYEFYILIA